MIKIFLFILLLSSCTTKYYMVRHAEKNNQSDTSTLTSAGLQRAEDLSLYFVKNKIKLDSIFVSTYRRTLLTGFPTSFKQNKNMVIVNQKPDSLFKFIARLEKIDNKCVLIVGHTNSIPAIIENLSGIVIRAIDEKEFDNLYILTRKGKDWSLEHLVYGKVKLTKDVLPNVNQGIK
jgi:phosphohistidine phosphatase SixA